MKIPTVIFLSVAVANGLILGYCIKHRIAQPRIVDWFIDAIGVVSVYTATALFAALAMLLGYAIAGKLQ